MCALKTLSKKEVALEKGISIGLSRSSSHLKFSGTSCLTLWDAGELIYKKEI